MAAEWAPFFKEDNNEDVGRHLIHNGELLTGVEFKFHWFSSHITWVSNGSLFRGHWFRSNSLHPDVNTTTFQEVRTKSFFLIWITWPFHYYLMQQNRGPCNLIRNMGSLMKRRGLSLQTLHKQLACCSTMLNKYYSWKALGENQGRPLSLKIWVILRMCVWNKMLYMILPSWCSRVTLLCGETQ